MSAAGRVPGIGVVGCGTIARSQHMLHLARAAGVRLAAAADPAEEARAAVARRHRVPVVVSAEELAARSDVDALLIASPSALHVEHALLAIENGKPFYLEKPLAIDSDGARRVLDAAAARGVAGCVGFNYRLQPVFAELRRRLAAEELGELLAVRTLFVEPLSGSGAGGWRAQRSSGGGVWLDLASHHVDLVRWLTGDEFVAVAAAEVASLRREHDRA
ncbi:MAG TPA: Gfo/Idh/MocA family oxidoreductase, partial [Thermoanaerobaculia bacterium]|nr:Gfo/Idh/MocA family oxidoreductase [Thermoanaerobaculia bacterium]